MQKTKIIFMGTPEFSVPVLEQLLAHYEVLAVVTQPDKPVGRKQLLTASPVKEVALAHHLPIFHPAVLKQAYQEILALEPEMIITCAYGQMLPKEILEFPRYGCINVHASLLPQYRGGAPIHRAIIDGCVETGITIMYMSAQMDAGDIIAQEKVLIEEDDTKGTLSEKLSHVGAELLLKTIPSILEGTIERKQQREEEATFAYTLTREEEKLDFHKTTRELYNQIRGMNPDPVAYTMLHGKRLKVYQARMEDHVYMEHEDGAIVAIYKDGIGVSTKDGELVLEEIQLEGKKRCLAKDFLNGVSKEELYQQILQ